MYWPAANTACAALGEHLPTVEQLKSLYLAYNTNPTPSFQSNNYWSITPYPGDSSGYYRLHMGLGGYGDAPQISARYVRCVH